MNGVFGVLSQGKVDKRMDFPQGKKPQEKILLEELTLEEPDRKNAPHMEPYLIDDPPGITESYLAQKRNRIKAKKEIVHSTNPKAAENVIMEFPVFVPKNLAGKLFAFHSSHGYIGNGVINKQDIVSGQIAPAKGSIRLNTRLDTTSSDYDAEKGKLMACNSADNNNNSPAPLLDQLTWESRSTVNYEENCSYLLGVFSNGRILAKEIDYLVSVAPDYKQAERRAECLKRKSNQRTTDNEQVDENTEEGEEETIAQEIPEIKRKGKGKSRRDKGNESLRDFEFHKSSSKYTSDLLKQLSRETDLLPKPVFNKSGKEFLSDMIPDNPDEDDLF